VLNPHRLRNILIVDLSPSRTYDSGLPARHTQPLLTELRLASVRLAAPDSLHDLRETSWTVGVSKTALGRIHAM
jgi:hypothetical protein